jgi:hypothetical protein
LSWHFSRSGGACTFRRLMWHLPVELNIWLTDHGSYRCSSTVFLNYTYHWYPHSTVSHVMWNARSLVSHFDHTYEKFVSPQCCLLPSSVNPCCATDVYSRAPKRPWGKWR